MSRAFKQWLARALIGVMLFGQFAIAAYACPGVSASLEQARQGSAAVADHARVSSAAQAAPIIASAVHIAMDCEQMPGPMDGASPNLCAEHCRQGEQSDQAGALTIPAMLLTSLYVVAPRSHALPVPPSAHSRVDLHAAVSPPHAILHCCLRD